MIDFVSPNDPSFYGETDSETIQNAIAAAEADGCRKLVIPRYNARTGKNEWRIPVSIKVPSDFTVILDNCYMVQETGVYDHMFTCLYSWDLEKCTKPEYEQRNIAIIGQGNVILDGGVHNHLLEKTSGKYHLPRVWKNTMFFWANVNGLRMENLHIENQRWWAITHLYCSNVKIRDLDFFAIPHVNNMDGIDLRQGCNHFDIQNITGRTGDDVLAMTALRSDIEDGHHVEGKDIHIHDVKVKNIKADPYYLFLVRLLNHDGCEIYNIDIDTLLDTSDYTKKRPSGACLIVGGLLYFREVPAQPGQTRNVRAKNFYSRGNQAVLMSRTLQNARISNVKTYGDNINGICLTAGCDVQDVTFEHFWYGAAQQEIFCSKDLNPENYKGTLVSMDNATGSLMMKDIHIDKIRNVVDVTGSINLVLEDLTYNSVDAVVKRADRASVTINGEVQ